MKKLFILLILGFSVPALAEIVSTVSFNPSRIGTYKYLKVSRDTNFKGGLETPTLNVQSAGEVTMRWDNANKPEKYYNVPTITGTTGPVSVDMPSTTFLQDTTLGTAAIKYSASDTAPSGVGAGPDITMTGGSLSFIDGTTNNDSYVSVLNGANTVQFYTDALNENTLNISGNAGKSVALTADGTTYTAKNESADTKGADSAYTRGFHLAGVDIPYPAGDYVQKTGTTSLSDSAALCWVQRCTTEGKVAWVLSLVNGTCPGKKDISCGGSLPDNPSAGLSWQYDGWEAVRSFMCGSGQQEAEQFCRQYPNTAPSGSCSKAGEVKYAMCSVNDYCPGHPIDAEVAKYTCK
ncbi:MAG: hypothetical protein J6J74_08000 [Elusimicrobiaceae bacterium]|nr:hypothetical protein [Elusimicrobiaceae bacterium]